MRTILYVLIGAASLAAAIISRPATAAAIGNCEHIELNDYLCEGFPQSEGVTYTWTKGSCLTFPTPNDPASPFRYPICNWPCSGPISTRYLHLKVTFPDGSFETASAPVCN